MNNTNDYSYCLCLFYLSLLLLSATLIHPATQKQTEKQAIF
ncbi:hypothetical protein PROVALCAL_00572 [Providencia alcalifaciens DSM 30120]|uniref:Uncharacterized protein n=1 Tax=Providencia alcalifaciens DSM 30120 TaxID=520999 RepID=B6XB25_9GAMM|nr:hypothetical protein PROVALCAL_00572 [Providencia alcalifaciens DSM 30120]